MTNWQIALLAAYGVVVAAAWARHWLVTRETRATPKLDRRSPGVGTNAAKVSILVPAKDEAAGIGLCLDALLAQDHPNFEALVIDDRSADGTAEVVGRRASADPRLKLLSIKDLPPGWTGKTHALHWGQQHADGAWLLFVDADTTAHPHCVSAAVRHAEDAGIDLLTALPAIEVGSFWAGVAQPFLGVTLAFLLPPTAVNDPRNARAAFANGQFILIRRTAYDRIGGHEAVRGKFVEDIHLGRRTRAAGLALRLALAPDLLRVRMYSSVSGIVKGWSRILYAAEEPSTRRLWLLVAMMTTFSLTCYAAVLGGGLAWWLGAGGAFARSAFLLGVLHAVGQESVFARTYRQSGVPLRYLAWRFLAVGIAFWIVFRAIRLCATRRVEWRGTVYGKDLGAH